MLRLTVWIIVNADMPVMCTMLCLYHDIEIYNLIIRSNLAYFIVYVKVGFHYPSSRAEFTGRVDGPRTRVHFLTPVNPSGDARVHGPCTRASCFHYPSSRPELTGVKKCTRVLGPSTRPVNSARELG